MTAPARIARWPRFAALALLGGCVHDFAFLDASAPSDAPVTDAASDLPWVPIPLVCTPTPDAGCPACELGSTIGEVAQGRIGRAPAVLVTSIACNDDSVPVEPPSGGGREVTLRWTAPFAGRWRFDSMDSSYDTLLYLIDGAASQCTGAQFACDDDISDTQSWSCVDPMLAAGQTVVVVVDAFDRTTDGTFVLHILPADDLMTRCP